MIGGLSECLEAIAKAEVLDNLLASTTSPPFPYRKENSMAYRKTVPVETLRQLLTYIPETGELFWKIRPAEM